MIKKQSIRKRGKARGKLGHGSPHHFTGKKSHKKARRKGLTRKQREVKRGKHVDRYKD